MLYMYTLLFNTVCKQGSETYLQIINCPLTICKLTIMKSKKRTKLANAKNNKIACFTSWRA